MPLGTSPKLTSHLSSNQELGGGADSQEDCDEMVEVTPEVQMYIGHSHFLAEMNGGDSASHSDEETPMPTVNVQPQIRLKNPSNLLTDKLQQLQSESKELKITNGVTITAAAGSILNFSLYI